MRLHTHDPVHHAKVDLIDLGGFNLAQYARAPVTSWVIGLFVVVPALVFIIGSVNGYGLFTWVLAASGAIVVGRWLGRETGGDHRIGDLAQSWSAELRNAAADYRARADRTHVRTRF